MHQNISFLHKKISKISGEGHSSLLKGHTHSYTASLKCPPHSDLGDYQLHFIFTVLLAKLDKYFRQRCHMHDNGLKT